MGTRSLIGVEMPDSSVQYVYCHWDGYLSHNGKILLNHYVDLLKVIKLMSYGHMSSLGKEIGKKHGFAENDTNYCTFYKRDRGETGAKINVKIAKSIKDFKAVDYGAEYKYLFCKDEKWRYCRSSTERFVILTKSACDKD